MKCWIVPSSLFVPGRIMAPIRLLREKEALLLRQEKLKAELKELPDKIAAAQDELAKISEEYVPFKQMERS